MALTFASGASVEMPKDVTFDEVSKISLFAWVNLSVTDNAAQNIICQRTGSSTAFQMRIRGSNDPKLEWTWSQSTTSQFYATGALPALSTDTWYALGIVFDWASPGSVKKYVNGTEYTASRNSGSGTTPANPDTPICIGKYDTDSLPLRGTVAFPARWNRVLTAAEMAQLANGFYSRHILQGLRSLPDLDRGIDLVTGASLTSVGSPTPAPNPRIFA
jgi:hypothetical protein